MQKSAFSLTFMNHTHIAGTISIKEGTNRKFESRAIGYADNEGYAPTETQTRSAIWHMTDGAVVDCDLSRMKSKSLAEATGEIVVYPDTSSPDKKAKCNYSD